MHAQKFDHHNEHTRELQRAILSLQSMDECERFLRDLCSIQELRAMTERWRIARLVWQGIPYRAITLQTGASSTTIARVAHWLQYGEGGYQELCLKFLGASMHAQTAQEMQRTKAVCLVESEPLIVRSILDGAYSSIG